jgi:hypothetical protein
MSKSLVSAQDRYFLAFAPPSFRNKERHQALARTCWHLSGYIAFSGKLCRIFVKDSALDWKKFYELAGAEASQEFTVVNRKSHISFVTAD